MKFFPLLFCLLISYISGISYEWDKKKEHLFIDTETSETLFVSIGSHCESAMMLKNSGLRSAAFPFDWIISIDEDFFFKVLENDFAFFFDPRYLKIDKKNKHLLLHSYYHFEFLHEGNFRKKAKAKLNFLEAKYQRRIERFRFLKKYKGKVFFLRIALEGSMDKSRVYPSEKSIEIDDESSLKLMSLLQSYFPKLNFTLLVINNCDGKDFFVEKVLSKNLVKLRLGKKLKNTDYSIHKEFFLSLVEE